MVFSQPFSSSTLTTLPSQSNQPSNNNQDTNTTKGSWNFSLKVSVNLPTENGGSVQMEMEASTGTKAQVMNILNKYK